MRLSAGACADSTCLNGVAIPFEVRLSGIDAPAMRLILAGRSVAAGWTARERSIHLDAHCPPASTGSIEFRHRFVDGTAVLRSGCAARVEVGPDSQPPEYLLPQSLNLALAQQWARLGLIALHAAALRINGLNVLALGPKASGKSTLSLATLAAEGQVLSDDWLLLGRDAARRPVCERLRRFLMVRDCWASETLQAVSPQLAFRRSGARPKRVLSMHGKQSRFPSSLAIDQIWVLERAKSGRGMHSLKRRENPTEVLVHLIKAAMPLLFSARFPHEHRAQMQTAQTLIGTCPAYQVQTGTDLVEHPAATLRRLTEDGT